MSTRCRRFLVGILIGTLFAIADATRAADNMVFVPLAPCRVIDTRALGAGGPLVAGTSRTFFFRGPDRNYATSQGGNANGCGIPDLTTDGGTSEENIAKAVVINIVAANPAGPGNLRAWAANQGMPTASLVNYSSANIANGVVVPMCDQVSGTPCPNGDITFLASVSGAHLVVDVTGYFHAGWTSFTLNNTALGHQALLSNTTGFLNTANGAYAMADNVHGRYNTALGVFALNNNTTANSNVAIGAYGLFNTSGSYNVGLGHLAGSNLTTGDNNICIGNVGEAGESGTTRIGTAAAQTRVFVAGIHGTTTGANDAVPVLIDSDGQLGTVSSSREVKQDIATLGDVSERLLGLRPVSFRYKEHAARGDTTPQFGLIAEEVEEVFPELVVHDARGRPETVKYHLLVPLLLNELQRMERREEAAELQRERQEAEITALRRRLERLEPLARDGPVAPARR